MAFDLDKYLNQTLVYWEKTGSDNSGRPTFKAPVQVTCRWEERQEQVNMLDGRIIQANGYIMTSSRIKNGSVVMLGTLANWKAMPTYPKIPTVSQGGFEVFKSNHTPDFDGANLLFEAWL